LAEAEGAVTLGLVAVVEEGILGLAPRIRQDFLELGMVLVVLAQCLRLVVVQPWLVLEPTAL
jgi:hypothetical protein